MPVNSTPRGIDISRGGRLAGRFLHPIVRHELWVAIYGARSLQLLDAFRRAQRAVECRRCRQHNQRALEDQNRQYDAKLLQE